MLRTTLFVSAMLVAALASAQTATSPAVVVSPGSAALISNVSIESGDSPLVQAAKRAVAARLKTPTRIIDNYRVKSSTKILTTSSSGGNIPTYPSAESGRPAESHVQTYPDPVVQQQTVQRMQQDLVRAAHEEDQGPYSDGQEDRSQQNLATIPGQLQAQRPPE